MTGGLHNLLCSNLIDETCIPVNPSLSFEIILGNWGVSERTRPVHRSATEHTGIGHNNGILLPFIWEIMDAILGVEWLAPLWWTHVHWRFLIWNFLAKGEIVALRGGSPPISQGHVCTGHAKRFEKE